MPIKHGNYSLLLSLCAILSLSGCANTGKTDSTGTLKPTLSQNNTQTLNDEAGDKAFITCPEPRPQICTREYNPVCARLQDGSVKTYATGCTACSDPAVRGYRPGACR